MLLMSTTSQLDDASLNILMSWTLILTDRVDWEGMNRRIRKVTVASHLENSALVSW